MGKRKKASKPPPKKKRSKLGKVFDCPFCGHEQTVDCYLERDEKIGRVECRVCGAKFRAIITHLDEEIDLYHKWIDACEDASKQEKAAAAVNSYTGGAGDEAVKDVTGRTSLGSDGGGSAGRKRSVDDFVDDDDDFDDEHEDDMP